MEQEGFDPNRHCGPFYGEDFWRMVCLVGFGLVVLAGTLLNGALLLTYAKNATRLLDGPHDYIIFTIVLTDFSMLVGCNIAEWVDYLVVPCFSIGYIGCFVQNYFDMTMLAQNTANVAMLSCDRLAMLTLGAKYP